MKKLLSVLLISFIILGCKKGTNVPLSFDYGSIENGIYDNTFFKFKLPVNPDWYVLNEDEANTVYKVGSEHASGDDESLKKVLKASEVNVAKLFTAFKVEPGTNYDFNPSIIINAENLSRTPSINTNVQFIIHAKRLLEKTAMQIEYVEENEKVKIGSEDFYFMKLFNTVQGIKITQDYYITLKKGFALAMILSYTTEEDKVIVYEMFDKLKI